MSAVIVTEAEKRTVACPKCGRPAGGPCVDRRERPFITAHRERRKAYIVSFTARVEGFVGGPQKVSP